VQVSRSIGRGGRSDAGRRPAIIAAIACARVVAGADPAWAAGAEEQGLTLTEAIGRAVAGNPDLLRERVAVDRSEALVQNARGDFDLTLLGGAVLGRGSFGTLGPEPGAATSHRHVILDVALARNLETGGAVQIGMTDGRDSTTVTSECESLGLHGPECSQRTGSVELRFTHPLLRGLGPDIRRAQLRRRLVERDQALLDREARAAEVVRDVIIAYWELAYATQDLGIRRSAVALAAEQLSVTNAQVGVGRSAPSDAAAVERAIAERRQDVLVAEDAVYFRGLELLRLLGTPAPVEFVRLVARDGPPTAVPIPDIGVQVARALEVNPQLRAVKLGIARSSIDVQSARSNALPQLDLTAHLGGAAEGAPWQQALRRALGLEDISWSVGLNLQLPIPNRTARGALRAARADEQSARLDVEVLGLQIREQVMRLCHDVISAAARVELARAAIGFARRNLDAERARFSVGRSTNNDVLLRQQELKNAETQAVRTTVELAVDDTTLAALTGELLERYGLVLRGGPSSPYGR
jgi:outer membrane protein